MKIQIVIDIPEDVYEFLKENDTGSIVDEAVKNGIPFRHLYFIISETLVEASKSHITPEHALEKIRQALQEFDMQRR